MTNSPLSYKLIRRSAGNSYCQPSCEPTGRCARSCVHALLWRRTTTARHYSGHLRLAPRMYKRRRPDHMMKRNSPSYTGDHKT
ncbi:hypothetical protein P301_O11706 [Saccharomyces cerevisiae P301]|uniref:Putative uncharacterized protein YOR072W-A n=2 Tax=Saccharomyces cerevisiae TaxID=4932 RepID=YO72A_YEAST|nr:RecName: Full=Putative uncharacterized protein YOR072W-A [Saccharomyces cerevisiae S288C]EWG83178.1 hypothetical protein R008_O11771 [Saccharomyces cerevisiae R008]EWG88818.1 hypothetical protein P301_O11706 [Saccharomyces cerevisiae P301]EWG93518.1 hypothetical protein R103_O11796 [Saccharomyces cerevisiae R103]KZV07959.1 hypothetical protein WN66_05901 [Saccharomyces cerevisiae]CAY86359.1 EC1118_1O4_2751p [Saccharomyces cerevisiae EC1118]